VLSRGKAKEGNEANLTHGSCSCPLLEATSPFYSSGYRITVERFNNKRLVVSPAGVRIGTTIPSLLANLIALEGSSEKGKLICNDIWIIIAGSL
jgi:hypothetical protein